MNKEILQGVAHRLNIYDESIVRTAEVYLRAYQSKGAVKAINDQAKTVLCLDIACRGVGANFDQETALALSGMKNSSYQNNLHSVEALLGLENKLSVADLCVQLGCHSVQDDAEEILAKYFKADNKIKDADHPQYAAAATYLACRKKKVSIFKPKIVTLSRLKPAQFKMLLNEFDKLDLTSNEPKKTKEKSAVDVDPEPQYIDEGDTEEATKHDEEVESYDSWKNRILNEAYAALKMGSSLKK